MSNNNDVNENVKPFSEEEVRQQLLAYWDGDSPLTLRALNRAYDKDHTLDDVGIVAIEARSYVNKYNSLIFAVAGKGPLVKGSEAESWLGKPMKKIVQEVHERAQPQSPT